MGFVKWLILLFNGRIFFGLGVDGLVMVFGQRVKKYRLEAQLTQEELSQKVRDLGGSSCFQTTINRMETTPARYSKYAPLIEKALGLEEGELTGETEVLNSHSLDKRALLNALNEVINKYRDSEPQFISQLVYLRYMEMTEEADALDVLVEINRITQEEKESKG